MESTQERYNFLFDRKEVKVEVLNLGSPPTKENAVKIISEKFSVPEKNVHVSKIEGKFGVKSFTIAAEIYNSEKDKIFFNTINKKKKVEKK